MSQVLVRRLARRAGSAALVAALLVAPACGDDDSKTDDAASDAAPTTTATEGDDGPPDVNPCAPGESGETAPPKTPKPGATPVEVTATEYAFAGADKLAAKGDYAVTLTNNGKELHELTFVRLDDSEKRPIKEILQSDERPKQTEIASTFACPGRTSAPTAASITEPGRYVLLCFIPVGTLPTTDPADFEKLETPHAAQGMIREFTVEG